MHRPEKKQSRSSKNQKRGLTKNCWAMCPSFYIFSPWALWDRGEHFSAYGLWFLRLWKGKQSKRWPWKCPLTTGNMSSVAFLWLDDFSKPVRANMSAFEASLVLVTLGSTAAGPRQSNAPCSLRALAVSPSIHPFILQLDRSKCLSIYFLPEAQPPSLTRRFPTLRRLRVSPVGVPVTDMSPAFGTGPGT